MARRPAPCALRDQGPITAEDLDTQKARLLPLR
jgi:hypothetical protein